MGWLSQPLRPHLRPLPLPRLLLIPGMGITAAMAELMATDTGLMAMDTTERGLLRPSPLPMRLLMLLLRLIPGTDTMAMATELMAMVAITGLMATMDTTERGLLRPSPLPMLLPLLPLMLMLMPGTDTMAMATELMAMVA